MKNHKTNIWFPAKSYGWGWGLPVTWQGWLAFILFIVLTIGFARSDLSDLFKFSAILILAIAFVLLCKLKGEKPRWRWGK